MVTATTKATELTPEQQQRLRELDMLLGQIDSYLAYVKRQREG